MDQHCICAIATPLCRGALSLIRISGKDCINSIRPIFFRKNGKSDIPVGKVCYGEIRDGGICIDEVILWTFKSPHSFTGEDMIEISCHGSAYIRQKIMECLMKHGCRLAEAGEFTKRAFLNGKMDLSQAEAVADLIASDSAASHKLAMQHLRGDFSCKIKDLRQKLIHIASLLELELDFSEEDVEFADRTEIEQLMSELRNEIQNLRQSFRLGNVFKNGIPVAIAGQPNTGKSSLLNMLLNEERAIVSDIPGTTRDTVEDTLHLGEHTFRFIDTAGLHKSEDVIENFGIERSYRAVEKSMLILYVTAFPVKPSEMKIQIEDLKRHCRFDDKKIIVILNKIDLAGSDVNDFIKKFDKDDFTKELDILPFSAKKGLNAKELIRKLSDFASGLQSETEVLISNLRHYEALTLAQQSLERAERAFENNVSTEFVMIDIKEVIKSIGSIVGEITSTDILASIFNNFCIGK